MTSTSFGRTYAGAVGIVLVLVGLLGFVPNPIVGPSALFATGTAHDLVHILTGAVALAIGLALGAYARPTGIVAFGALYAVVFVALLASPTLFGILSVPVNAFDQLLHAGLAVVSVAVGFMARAGETAVTA